MLIPLSKCILAKLIWCTAGAVCKFTHPFLHNTHYTTQSYLMHKRGNPQETFGGGEMPKFAFESCPWVWICVTMTTCCYDSPTPWQDEITCWCLTRCLTSRHFHTYRTPGLKRVAGAFPTSSCPDLTVAFPRTWCWCLPILAWLEGHRVLMCSASSSALECSSFLALCHWGRCLSEKFWDKFHHINANAKYNFNETIIKYFRAAL